MTGIQILTGKIRLTIIDADGLRSLIVKLSQLLIRLAGRRSGLFFLRAVTDVFWLP